jgi:hypothetical protein
MPAVFCYRVWSCLVSAVLLGSAHGTNFEELEKPGLLNPTHLPLNTIPGVWVDFK